MKGYERKGKQEMKRKANDKERTTKGEVEEIQEERIGRKKERIGRKRKGM